jgi:hypothetical protein
LKAHGATDVRFVCVLATLVGLARVHERHPDVRIWTAAIDDELDNHGYIRPGLGDAGDRLYGPRWGRIFSAAPSIRSALHEAYLCGVSTCFAQLGAPLSPFKNGSTVCAISGAMNNS